MQQIKIIKKSLKKIIANYMTKTIEVRFPYMNKDIPYVYEVPQEMTAEDIIKANMPKNWQWNDKLRIPEPI